MASASINIKWIYQNNFGKKFEDFIKANIDAIINEVLTIMAQKQVSKATEIKNRAVDTWYGSYTRSIYDPTMSLRDIFTIEAAGPVFTFMADTALTYASNQDSAYVGDLAFFQGLHGGPIWRTPCPWWTFPLGPAVATDPIYNMIQSEWSAYVHGEGRAEALRILKQVVAKYVAMFH